MAASFDYNIAMRRLVYMVLLGCGVVIAYGFEAGPSNKLNVISVGLMAAGAALLSGGLLGFLFGIPHTRDGESVQRSGTQGEKGQASGGRSLNSYRPNTSLEQISDWLTKILVGVSLVQIKEIHQKFVATAAYISKGLGSGDQAQAFAATILVYFSVCGFVFGFLWARLYLPRWFAEADELQSLDEKVTQLERRQQADAKALALVTQQLNRTADDPAVEDKEIADAIRAASPAVRALIFSQGVKASEDKEALDYDTKNDTAISIFRGLISSDTANRYHRNHGELGYALSRKSPPDAKGAEEELTKAIEIRDRLGKKGWKYYEMRRAKCRLQQNPQFDKDAIMADLRAAASETEKWDRWYDRESVIQTWMNTNGVNVLMLRS